MQLKRPNGEDDRAIFNAVHYWQRTFVLSNFQTILPLIGGEAYRDGWKWLDFAKSETVEVV